MRRRLLLTASVLLPLAAAAPALAADPIMPLSEVQPGMHCTSLTVLKGTTPTPFDVEIVDVVPGDQVSDQPLLLVRVSGDAIDAFGIAEGFSGSPVICDGKIAGAIAYGTGDYGNHLGYVTPIEAMLGEPVPPVPTNRTTVGRALRPQPLATPVAVSGISKPVFAPFAKAAKRVGIKLTAVPVAPDINRFPVQTLFPGASVAVGLSSGDVTAGAVGTVTYVDGNKVYAFGHPYSGTGRRSLLLQDAYVYDVIGNPLDTTDAVSSKIAAPGHDLGTLTYDGRDGVAGLLGATPPSTALTITARNAATGTTRISHAQVADEAAVGLPDGVSPIALTAPMAVAQAAYTALDGSPVLQSARMCLRLTIEQVKKPVGFCRRYTGDYGGDSNSAGGPFVADLQTALTDLDLYNYGTPAVTKADVSLTIEPGLKQSLLRGVKGPKVLHPGEDARVEVELQHWRGSRYTKTATLHVPRDVPKGRVTVALTGKGLDGGSGGDDVQIVLGGGGGDTGSDTGPKSFTQLTKQIQALGGTEGLKVRYEGSGQGRATGPRLQVDPTERITGAARFSARVER
jgi:hypothetical protein